MKPKQHKRKKSRSVNPSLGDWITKFCRVADTAHGTRAKAAAARGPSYLDLFPRKIETFRIVAMGPSLVQWMGLQCGESLNPHDVTMGVNLVPVWVPGIVSHGIAMDDFEDDEKRGHVRYVKLVRSVSHVPMFTSSLTPDLGRNFHAYPLAAVDRSLSEWVPEDVRQHLWVNTLVYALALALHLHEKGRGVRRIETWGWGHREAEFTWRPKNWRDYHGRRSVFEPGAEEYSYLLAVANARGIVTWMPSGTPLLGHDRYPMLHGYREVLMRHDASGEW